MRNILVASSMPSCHFYNAESNWFRVMAWRRRRLLRPPRGGDASSMPPGGMEEAKCMEEAPPSPPPPPLRPPVWTLCDSAGAYFVLLNISQVELII